MTPCGFTGSLWDDCDIIPYLHDVHMLQHFERMSTSQTSRFIRSEISTGHLLKRFSLFYSPSAVCESDDLADCPF